jgi:hypothetical protein
MESQLVWCSCCGKDIWVLPNTKIEDFLCTECKKIFDAYEDIMEESIDWCSHCGKTVPEGSKPSKPEYRICFTCKDLLDNYNPYEGDENGTTKETTD